MNNLFLYRGLIFIGLGVILQEIERSREKKEKSQFFNSKLRTKIKPEHTKPLEISEIL